MQKLALTGERTVPGIWHETYWFVRHEVVYRWVDALLPKPGRVLDAGAGEGYGAALLRRSGRDVVAVDYDVDAATHAHRAHEIPSLRANLVALPFTTDAFDAVVSLQVVEHMWDQATYVAECGRALRRDGHLVVSTPNRITFSPGLERGEKPFNPFHVDELDAEQLATLLAPVGPVQLYGVHEGPRIRKWQRQHGSVVEAQQDRPYDEWDEGLASFVRGLGVTDFAVRPWTKSDHDTALDLVAVVTRA